MMENNQELELNIADYLKIVWRYKWAILIITIITTTIIFIPTLNKKPVYESSTLVSPARINNQYVENIETTITILQQENTLRELAIELELPIENAYLLTNQFNASPKGDLLEINGSGSTPEQAKKITEIVSNFILNRQNSILETKEKLMSDQESIAKKEQIIQKESIIKEEILFLEKKIEENKSLIKEFENKIKKIEEENNQNQGEILAAYLNNLATARIREDGLQNMRYEKKLDLKNLDFEKLNLKKPEPQIQKSFIVSPSYLPTRPIPVNKKNTILIGVLLGLFIGIFYAFVVESSKKSGKTI